MCICSTSGCLFIRNSNFDGSSRRRGVRTQRLGLDLGWGAGQGSTTIAARDCRGSREHALNASPRCRTLLTQRKMVVPLHNQPRVRSSFLWRSLGLIWTHWRKPGWRLARNCMSVYMVAQNTATAPTSSGSNSSINSSRIKDGRDNRTVRACRCINNGNATGWSFRSRTFCAARRTVSDTGTSTLPMMTKVTPAHQ